tara:strand:+ start:1433 stop:2230 length:798 start_codon:yes stop_codon:yes gene_type:complete
MKIVVRFAAIITLAAFIGPLSADAQSLDSLLSGLSRGDRERLVQTGAIEQYIENHRRLSYAPDHPLARAIEDRVNEVRPNVISEQIVLVRGDVDRVELLRLYNSLRRVSDLSYLQYYNERKDSTNELFHDSFAVAGPEDRTPVSDPTVTSIPEEDTVWVLQGLPPFGTILSRYRYRSGGEAFLFSGTNVDTLTYRSVPVVQPGNMITDILVIPGDGFVLMYGVGAVRAFKMFGLLDDRIEAAFSGRTEGLFNWYRDTYLVEIGDN